MKLAESLGAGDQYIKPSREGPSYQISQLKANNPYGFDIVVEATGNVNILKDSINYVRRGGKLVIYGDYSKKDHVSLSPSKISKYFHISRS